MVKPYGCDFKFKAVPAPEGDAKKTIDQGYTEVLEQPGGTTDKTCDRNFRDIAADSKGLHFYDRGRHLQFGQSYQLQETGISHNA